jgi:hypothetical protein
MPAAGAVVWWNLDLAGSEWPQRTAFLPFFGELLQHLAERSGAGRAVREFQPGQALRFEAGAALDPAICGWWMNVSTLAIAPSER